MEKTKDLETTRTSPSLSSVTTGSTSSRSTGSVEAAVGEYVEQTKGLDLSGCFCSSHEE